MLKNKMYNCGICKTKPDQISHHKLHVSTQKHKDKKELFELKLSKLSSEELEKQYSTNDITNIVKNKETIVYTPPKKLNNDDDIVITDDDIIKMSESNIVSNKEALKDKIHEIHNFLRNNGAGYGMNALKVFNILYGLKKIEENKLLDKINLKQPDCVFSHLLKLANKNKDEELAELIYGSILDSINDSKISRLLFYEIPRNMKSAVFNFLIKEIDKITQIEKKCNVLLSGKIYEYFIGRDESAISELGAYFTDRHIVNYIYDKLQPELNKNNEVESMIDMFGGSGGFTTGYINYLNNKYPDEIKWKNELHKIHHYDMNEDVIKSAGLEFFCLTGIIPNMKQDMMYKNSFTDEFGDRKYHYVITNPPYGGDKKKINDTQIKRKKVKDYILDELKTLDDEDTIKKRKKQLKIINNLEEQEKKDIDKNKVSIKTCSARIQKYAHINKLSGNDKESASLILMMDLLDDDGTCIGVLKEGVFFDKKYKDLRKCLISTFNVREVISVPSDQFENTSTKTSIVIFDNTEQKTTSVKFYDLVVERYENDKFEEINDVIILTENKGDVKNVRDTLISTAPIDDVINNKIYSLNGKDYNKKQIVCGDDYKLVKLSDVCDVKLGTRITKKNNTDGKYPVYGGGDITFYTDTHNRDKNTLIVSRYALSKTCVRLLPHKFYLNDSGLSLHTKNDILQKYINFYFLCDKNQKYIYKNCISGSIQKNLNMNLFHNMSVSIPKSEKKIKKWVDKISKPYDEINEKQNKIKELEVQIQEKIKDITENKDCDYVEYHKIGNIYCGKALTKKQAIDGKYKVFGGGNTSYTHDEYNLDGFNILISRVGNNSVTIINDKIYLTDNGFSLKINDISIKKYVGYYLLNNKNIILTLGNGSAQKVITKTQLNSLHLPIPKNKKLITKMEPLFEEIEQLQSEVNDSTKLYNKYIQELSDEAIPKNKQVDIVQKEESDNESSNDEKEIKKDKHKKINKSSDNEDSDEEPKETKKSKVKKV